MPEFMIGAREQVGIVEEDGGYATLDSNTMSNAGFIPGKDVRFEQSFSHDFKEIINSGATTRNVESMEKGTKSYPFTLTFKVTDWRFLKYCMYGTVSNTDNTTYYTHTYTQTNAALSFTTEWAKRGSTNEVITLTGCVIKRISLAYSSGTGEGDGFIEATCECVAKSLAEGTSVTTISVPSANAFQFRMAKLTVSGTETVEVNSGELNFDNGVNEEDSRYANSTLDQEIGEPIPTVSRYDCTFNINQKDSTFYDIWATEAEVTGTNKLEFIRGTNDNIIFTFTGLSLKALPSSNTNIEGINNLDLVGVVRSVAPVANDARSDY